MQSIIPAAAEVSTRSRPKAAGCDVRRASSLTVVSTRSRPKAAGYLMIRKILILIMKFQHAAARRRLAQKPVTDDS